MLAVDGGQSAIRVRHSDVEQVILVDGVSRLEGDPIASVAESIGTAFAQLPAADLAVLGLTTSPSSLDDQARLCALVSSAGGPDTIWLADDTVTSHVGGLSSDVGVSLVVGTGVACLARGTSAPPRVFDGLGYLLGDDGGAWSIGRAGLRAVLFAHEGRGPDTSLTAEAIERFGPLDGLHIRLHELPRPVNVLAHFARDVLDAASAGDLVSGAIVDRAAADLCDTTLAAARWTKDAEVAVALGGRLVAEGSELRRRLDIALDAHPHLVPRSADDDALAGAIALGRSGVNPFTDLVHVWTKGTSQ